MKATILINYDENIKKVEEEERNRFLKSLLDQLTIPTDDFWTIEDSSLTLSVDQRIKLRQVLLREGIQIIEDLEGFMQVFINNELVGSWNKPHYVLKKDLSQLDPKKQLYIEMNIECWTIYEIKE